MVFMRHLFSSPSKTTHMRYLGYVGLVLLSGCAVKPEAISQAEYINRAKADISTIHARYVPATKPVTLSEAIARGLKYNFDAEMAKMEINLQQKQANLALYQLMPKLAADAGYNWRNNYNAAASVDVVTGQPSLTPSYSEERIHTTADLSFSWNLLDAGISYFQAKQQGYRALVAVERRRKAIEGIIKTIQQAYLKAVTAERVLPLLDPLLVRAEKALDASRASTADNLQPAMQALDFQQNMLQVIGQIRRMRTELSAAKLQLAALINVPDVENLKLADTDTAFNPVVKKVDIRKLEEMSLAMRPELREAMYQEKIDRQDVYKEMVKMMPGVGVLASLNTDSNRYLYNNNWSQVGINATWNLLNVIQGPQAISAARTSAAITRTRRLALGVAVMTQVNLSYVEYFATLDDYKTANDIHMVQQKIRKASIDATNANIQSEAESVRRDLAAMVALLQREQAISQAHSSLINLYSAVGADLVPPNADLDELPAMTANINRAIAGWWAGKLPEPVSMAPATVMKQAPAKAVWAKFVPVYPTEKGYK
jgi:outer membrane protein TolC